MRQAIRSAGSAGNAAADELPVLRIREQPAAPEEVLLRRIEADELDVGRDAEAVEQARPHRGAARGLFAGQPRRQVEVVHHLAAVVAFLGLAGVVVADRRAHRHPVDRVAVGLKEREEPVVVFVAGILGPEQESLRRVDVVAGRQDQAHVLGVDGALQRQPDLALPFDRRRRPADARAEVADHRERERRRRAAGSDPAACGTRSCSCRRFAPGPEDRRIPVPAQAGGPGFVLHPHRVGVARVRLQPGDLDVVALVGHRRGDDRAALVAHFDVRRAVGLRSAADRIAARRVHPLQIVVVHQLRRCRRSAPGSRTHPRRSAPTCATARQGRRTVRRGIQAQEFIHPAPPVHQPKGVPLSGSSRCAMIAATSIPWLSS